MKKVALLLLSALLMLACFVGCEKEVEVEDRVFSINELNITLTSEFEFSGPKSEVASEDYTVKINRIPFSNITPNEGAAFPSLITFMQEYMSMAQIINDKVSIKTEDGLTLIDADQNSDGTSDMLIVMYESKEAFWEVRFTSSLDYETARAQCMTWAKNVTFSEAE